MTTHPLCKADNLFDFFHEAVDAAVSSRRAPVSEDGVYYLTNLLAERGRAPEHATPETLVDLQIMACENDGARSINALRELLPPEPASAQRERGLLPVHGGGGV